jgi:opacity protein-like surface antigen
MYKNKFFARTIVGSMIVFNCIHAGGLNDIEVNFEVLEDIITKNTDEYNYFVFLSGGVSSLNVDSKLEKNHSFNEGALDDSAILFELGLGYRFNENIFSTLFVQNTQLDIADITNLGLSVNYQFNNEYKPYIGFFTGTSQLKWSEEPHVVLLDKDLTSKSPIFGLQAGVEKNLNNNWAIFAKYQLTSYNHEIDIRRGRSTIKHTAANNLLLGVKYEF